MDYKDLNVLKEEAEEGRRLGFDGKVRMVIPLRKSRLGSDADDARCFLSAASDPSKPSRNDQKSVRAFRSRHVILLQPILPCTWLR